MEAAEIIELLKLKPLPEEGGFYSETFRDSGRIAPTETNGLQGERSYSTSIYYLVTPEEFSGLHSVKSAEIFHFYAGDPVEMIQISNEGDLKQIKLGNNLQNEERPQVVVPPNTWQGTKLFRDGKWALLGCTVSPGFEYEDFTGGNRSQLFQKFPQHSEWVKKYTRA